MAAPDAPHWLGLAIAGGLPSNGDMQQLPDRLAIVALGNELQHLELRLHQKSECACLPAWAAIQKRLN